MVGVRLLGCDIVQMGKGQNRKKELPASGFCVGYPDTPRASSHDP